MRPDYPNRRRPSPPVVRHGVCLAFPAWGKVLALAATAGGVMADTTGSDASGSTAPARGGGASDDPRHGQGADPYLKSMLLGLIEDSYLHTGSFTQFAAEILQVIAYAATVPVAFTEGFLRAYLSIDRIEETDEGRIKIIPKVGAAEEDWIKDVDEITAQVDPSAVFNPVVRSKLTAVHESSSKVMKYDLNTLTGMDDDQLMDVLRQMQQESEELEQREPEAPATDSSRDYIRARLDTIRRNVRAFQAQQRATAGADDGPGEPGRADDDPIGNGPGADGTPS
jgi:hypothetical protein